MTIEEKIIKDIEKTGFITELKAVSLLIEKGWETEHSMTYEDKDENKSREIDIVATMVDFVDELGFRLIIYLVIEVKKTDKPWIVFTTEKNYSNIGWRIMHHGINMKQWIPDKKNGFFTNIFESSIIDKNHPRQNLERIGKAFHEFGKTASDKSKIYQALISSCKAAQYFNGIYGYSDDESKDFNPAKVTDIAFFLPIVLLEGNLYEVYNQQNGQIKVQKEYFIPVEMKYSSPNYRQHNWDVDFLPDIITFDYFPQYIDVIALWRQTMLDGFKAVLQKNGKKPFDYFLPSE